MIAVAQDAQGAARVMPVVSSMGVKFPVLVDEQSRVAAELGFRMVPAGALLDADGAVAYASDDDFDIADPRLRCNLESFLAGEALDLSGAAAVDPDALEMFAEGARLHASGQRDRALGVWREALERDPENFLIRSQIWTVEHPDRFWPAVDRDWQERQLMKEGYDGPLP